MLNFHIYDVFTTTPFTGNPLAIVEGTDDLSTAQMQTIARQFNLSETIFVQTPDDPAHSAKVRIFFPTAEIPFAGHPTIGCALHLAADTATEITLEEVAGLVPVTISDGMAEFTAPKLPTPKTAPSDADLLAAAIGLEAQDLGLHRPGHFEGGPAFLYAQVASLEALAKARVMEPAFTHLVEQTSGHGAIYLYTATPDGFQTRMFHPHAGIAEDPATGSATALFAGQLHANGVLPATGTTAIALQQGVEMGRPSDLRLTIDTTDGQITAVRVAGRAVKIAHGQIRIPDPLE
jgi:trans-2,3-dihydro-3-hydroxyanthranilate isomerase